MRCDGEVCASADGVCVCADDCGVRCVRCAGGLDCWAKSEVVNSRKANRFTMFLRGKCEPRILRRMHAPAPASSPSPALRAILIGGLLAGVGDITQAFVVFGIRNGITPVRVLQSVAVGLFGRAAVNGGAKMAIAGLLLHFSIATIWAAAYVGASRWVRLLRERTVLCGPLYGVIVFLFMYQVVLPLSRVARDPRSSLFTVPLVITGWFGHPLLVGLPIAWATRRFAR